MDYSRITMDAERAGQIEHCGCGYYVKTENSAPLTETEVKAILPYVRMQLGDKHYICRPQGRLNGFAQVTPMYESTKNGHVKEYKILLLPPVEYSWAAVTKAINDNKTLIA